jgi:hypothetical protein
MSGWIRIHRKIRSNPIFNDLQLFRLWTICLLEASHKPHSQLAGKQTVDLEQGQFLTGRFDLHAMYNKGLKRSDHVSEYTVWRWLQTLEKQEFLIIKSSNKYSIVTIVNWTLYQTDDHQYEQDSEQQMSSKRSTNDQQMSTNKNVKNGNNKELISTEIENFRCRYSAELLTLIDEYLLFIASMRKKKNLADSVVVKVYTCFSRVDPVRVEYAMRTHMGNPEYSKAKEEYTFGIIRNTTAEEAQRKLQAGHGNKKSGNPLTEKNEQEKEKIRRLMERERSRDSTTLFDYPERV